MLEPRIETQPVIHLVGLHAKFISVFAKDTNAPETIGPLWGALHDRLGELTPTEPGVFYGYTWLEPEENRSRPDELGYLAGVEVAPGSAVPDGMVALDTAPGLYAVFEHRGVIETFHDTVRSIYEEWLPRSGFVGNGAGDLERYGLGWAHDREDSVFEFRVGIRPR
jgi:AraC family transcriptional regulator